MISSSGRLQPPPNWPFTVLFVAFFWHARLWYWLSYWYSSRDEWPLSRSLGSLSSRTVVSGGQSAVSKRLDLSVAELIHCGTWAGTMLAHWQDRVSVPDPECCCEQCCRGVGHHDNDLPEVCCSVDVSSRSLCALETRVCRSGSAAICR